MDEVILMVEDVVEVIEVNCRILKRRNYNVLTATSVKEALSILSEITPSLLILDVMLPDGTGYEICEKFRKTSDKPVLFLSAKNNVNDRVDGLKHGGDYYLTKPYNFDELLAVIERLLYRDKKQNEKQKTIITSGNLLIDMSRSLATLGGKDIYLTKTEFSLLSLFLQNKNCEIDRKDIYESIWGSVSNDDTRVLSKHISKLRTKTNCENSEYYDILPKYGKGYIFIEY